MQNSNAVKNTGNFLLTRLCGGYVAKLYRYYLIGLVFVTATNVTQAESCLAQALFLAGRQAVYVGGVEKAYRICIPRGSSNAGAVRVIADNAVKVVWPKGASNRCIDLSGRSIEIDAELGLTLEYGAI